MKTPSKSSAKMEQIIVYVHPKDIKKLKKRRGEYGFISDSAYLRYLAEADIGKVKKREP